MYNPTKSHIHFIGIGGIGMSGIAKILRFQGYRISGCDKDLKQQSIVDLQTIGCHIYEGNNTPACKDDSIDIVVYSSAIKAENPEIVAAQKKGIPTIARALMLAELMRMKYSVAIAGSHGKTTTTSLISHILIEAGLDPTVIIGGHLKNISANARLGKGDFLVAEADESDRSLLHLQSTLAIVTNIDFEHTETYKDLHDVQETFYHFITNLPFYGKAFLCADDPHIRAILPIVHIKTVLYGLHTSAHIRAENISLEPNFSSFSVIHQGENLGTITLSMPGIHNVTNALAAIALARDLEIPFSKIQSALSTFAGIARRFCYRGTFLGAEMFDDYGHHPKEIFHTLEVARKRAQKKLTVLFQPHRYSRTYHLWNEFMRVFSESIIDHLIITDIFAASEKPINGVSSKAFVQALQKINPSMLVSYVPFDPHFQQIRAHLESNLADGDLLLLLGAGKIYQFPDHI